MKLENLIPHIRNIVALMPSNIERPNTFVLFDDRTELESRNLGKNIQDFESGAFWCRSWFLKGAHAGKIYKEYPILALEVKSYNSDPSSQTVFAECMFSILNVVEGKTDLETDSVNMSILTNFLHALTKDVVYNDRPNEIFQSNFGVDGVKSLTTQINIELCYPDVVELDFFSLESKKLGLNP